MGALGIMVAAVLLAAGLPDAWAHEAGDQKQYQYGQITGTSHRTVSINGREYALHPKVVIQDDEGRPKQLHDFKLDTYVQYRLKDELVRQLILVTPK
jgi:hypothetical protein